MTRILAVDCSQYAIRVALTEAPTCRFLEGCEAKPEQVPRIVRFVARNLTKDTVVVGAKEDLWPIELRAFLAEKNARVQLLPLQLLRPVSWQLSPWQQKLRLHRARLLAYLSSPARRVALPRLVLEWQCHLHQEALAEARQALDSILALEHPLLSP